MIIDNGVTLPNILIKILIKHFSLIKHSVYNDVILPLIQVGWIFNELRHYDNEFIAHLIPFIMVTS